MLFIKLMIWHKKPLLVNHLKIIGKDCLRDEIIMAIMKHVIKHVIEIGNKAIKELKELPTIRYLITPNINNILNSIVEKQVKRLKSLGSFAIARNKLKPSHATCTLILVLTKLAIAYCLGT
jgi:hypothetical protein